MGNEQISNNSVYLEVKEFKVPHQNILTDGKAAQALTFYVHYANHLRIAVSVPNLTHICARVTGLCSLYQ